ncbi:right-handed parallel beta-helix repeat-containing protein [Demequina sp. SO4-13]|uniref:right-handed parallel beta-helix repeat-containing protein n=1 Tax=Demequina sp. SO4-13 TaxID=3401027 RepID=UPI003AF94164
MRMERRQGILFAAAVLVAALAGGLVGATLVGDPASSQDAQSVEPTPTATGDASDAPSPSPTNSPSESANPGRGVAVDPSAITAPPDDMPSAHVDGDLLECGAATITVEDGDELAQALSAAGPGDVIGLAEGRYEGEFSLTASGTAEEPLWVCGESAAAIVGEGYDGGYGLHVDGAQHVRIVGLTVTQAQKGIMVDGGEDVVIDSVTVHGIGDEGIHLRTGTIDSVVRGSTVYDTGNRREKFGEGIYIGSAESNWCDLTDCEPDRSDRNVVEGNIVFDVTAEAVDVKEGTVDGVLRGNAFDGAELIEDGGDSWVDIKGNDYEIVGNSGIRSNNDGFQTHEILDGWGTGNVFADNTAVVRGPGYGFSLTPERDNVVMCSNTVEEAGEGYSNTDCQ